MHPACEICDGACCKFFGVQKTSFKADVANWIALHGVDEGDTVRFMIPCTKLEGGKCSIYETRPHVCKTAEVGGRDCLDAIGKVAKDREAEILKAMGPGLWNR